MQNTDGTAAPLSLAQLERQYLLRMLGEHNGNISATARTLNMHRRTLQRKLARQNEGEKIRQG